MKLQVKQMVRASGLEHLLARRLAMELLTQTGVEEQPASPLFVIPCKTALQARVVTYLVENPLASSYEVASALHCSVQYVRSVKRNTGRRL
jgi:hypothetical protein